MYIWRYWREFHQTLRSVRSDHIYCFYWAGCSVFGCFTSAGRPWFAVAAGSERFLLRSAAVRIGRQREASPQTAQRPQLADAQPETHRPDPGAELHGRPGTRTFLNQTPWLGLDFSLVLVLKEETNRHSAGILQTQPVLPIFSQGLQFRPAGGAGEVSTAQEQEGKFNEKLINVVWFILLYIDQWWFII